MGTWLPDDRIRVEALQEHLSLTNAQVKVLTRVHGLRELRTSPDATVLDALREAGARALRAAGPGAAQRIRYVLHAHTMQDVAPSTVNVVASVRDALGLRDAVAFSVTQQNCASGLLAVDIAGRLLHADDDEDALALVLMGEKPFTPLAQLIPNTTVMGEAAAACVVRRGGDRDRVLAYASRTLGEYSGGLSLTRAQLRDFELAYAGTLGSVIEDAVAQAGLSLSDISLVLGHNVNRSSWLRVADRLELDRGRVFLTNVPRLGHCYCADPFLNYESAREYRMLTPGAHYLMAAVGLGATFTALVARH